VRRGRKGEGVVGPRRARGQSLAKAIGRIQACVPIGIGPKPASTVGDKDEEVVDVGRIKMFDNAAPTLVAALGADHDLPTALAVEVLT
jgi:hypothetical protein